MSDDGFMNHVPPKLASSVKTNFDKVQLNAPLDPGDAAMLTARLDEDAKRSAYGHEPAHTRDQISFAEQALESQRRWEETKTAQATMNAAAKRDWQQEQERDEPEMER